MLAACDGVPLLAPRESTISVTSQALSLPPGGTTTITALVMESGGNAVHDGTRVSFSATLGRVEPAEVETRGGTATTTFVAGSASGTAQVRAMSGAATASGTTGEGATATAGNVVQIAIGGAAATAVAVSATPSRVGPSGGTVTIIGSALDGSGNRLTGVPISFSTTAGTLSASSALSDSAGEARVTLNTNREATVTARAGAQSATVVVAVATAGTVTLATSPAAPVSGSPVTLTVTPAAGTSPRVVVNWGDGSAEDLGIVAAVRSVTHTYPRAGSYTITTQATADGETFANAISISVGSAAAGLTLSDPSPASPSVGTPVVFTVTPGTGTTPRVVIEWGDGSSTDLGTVSAARSAAHTYAQAGTFIVTATAEASGDTFATSKAVTVTAVVATPVSVTIASSPSSPVNRCVEVTFTASVATSSADPVTTYSWSGAGESGDATNTPSITTRYSNQGTQQIRVNVVTSSGRTGSQTLNFTVNNAGPTSCT
jgi:hypothetical protein